jgi:hypothetical protein
MAFQIAGNCVANNARVRLTPVLYSNSTQSLVTYTNASGTYTFTNVPAGVYHMVADLNEVTAAHYNSGYVFISGTQVSMDAAGDNLVDVNLTPVLKNSVYTAPRAF